MVEVIQSSDQRLGKDLLFSSHREGHQSREEPHFRSFMIHVLYCFLVRAPIMIVMADEVTRLGYLEKKAHVVPTRLDSRIPLDGGCNRDTCV